VLESSGFLTQKDIVRQSYLPARTVRYALNRLKEEQIIGFYYDSRNKTLLNITGELRKELQSYF